jgi:alpha/beta superfamily hydrolase
MKVLNAPEWELQWPVLRFNFRGAGLSEGRHDGRAESADVLAALQWLESAYRRPIVVAGFSFGAAMALTACCGATATHTRVCAVAALGLPTQAFGHQFRYRFLANSALPKLFLSGDQDGFAPSADLTRVVDAASEPKKLVLIPGADHSFSGQMEAMQLELAAWLKEYMQ